MQANAYAFARINQGRAGSAVWHTLWSSCPEVDSLTRTNSLACSHMLWGVLAAWPLWSGPLPSLSPELRGLCLPHGAWALSLNLVSKYTAASRNSSLSSWASSHGKCRRNEKDQEEGGVILFSEVFKPPLVRGYFHVLISISDSLWFFFKGFNTLLKPNGPHPSRIYNCRFCSFGFFSVSLFADKAEALVQVLHSVHLTEPNRNERSTASRWARRKVSCPSAAFGITDVVYVIVKLLSAIII